MKKEIEQLKDWREKEMKEIEKRMKKLEMRGKEGENEDKIEKIIRKIDQRRETQWKRGGRFGKEGERDGVKMRET